MTVGAEAAACASRAGKCFARRDRERVRYWVECTRFCRQWTDPDREWDDAMSREWEAWMAERGIDCWGRS